eukprot:gnl/MRDRNA2_/MRDRNA2_76606_c0_seq1.p1 gnl/MRDRNA2_/MRDRNA2_76606_c0~~gnl/MRDRNA2_/MRDRNA2_76606_c0_seq1.p1  ORF type:complete len:357 (-),score=54.67 gnl/MRDRNA2_/MRDRNA2_76606_c0_seq1:12-1082(-)
MFLQTRFGLTPGMKPVVHQWFEDSIPLGAYKVVDHVTTMRQGPELSSKEMRAVGAGYYLQVIETRHVREDHRLRARLLGGGWVSIKDTDTGHVYAEALPTGVYKIVVENMTVRSSHLLRSVGRTFVRAGMYVEVEEVKYVWQEKRIRARFPDGGWISIEDTKTGQKFAEHIAVGTYTVGVEGASVQMGVNPRSKNLQKDLAPGSHIQVVEIKYLPQEKVARARLQTGGWVSIGFTRKGCKIVEPVPLGKYKVMIEKLSVHSEKVFTPANTNMMRRVFIGEEIEVLETALVPELSRVRGRIVGGGWVSLFNIDTGAWLAQSVAMGRNKAVSDMYKLRRAGLTGLPVTLDGFTMPTLA